MSQALIEKIRKAREITIYAGGHGFTVRRPTDLEAATLRGRKVDLGEFFKQFVVGWQGVKEIDIYSGGDPVDAPFSPELFAEFIADRPNLWAPLQTAIITAYESHIKKMDDSLVEPGAG
jgi:hypothetical protein